MGARVQDVIMLFGDSITQGGWEDGKEGFGQRLSHVYARRRDVLNRGLSGYNTEWAMPVFERCLVKKHESANVPKIRILTVWFGANDACLKHSAQHVPLNKFTSNLRQFVDMIQSSDSPYHSPETRIILMSPPPVNTYQRGADLASRDPPLALDRDFDTTRRYANAVKEVAVEKGVAFVDIWTAFWRAAGEDERSLSKFLWDGLHPNREGYALVYDEIINSIRERYPEEHYDNIPFVFPPWLQVFQDSIA